jgi:hypothetical protein
LRPWRYVGPGLYSRGDERIELRDGAWWFAGEPFRTLPDAQHAADTPDPDPSQFGPIVQTAQTFARAKFPRTTIIALIMNQHGCTPAVARAALARV